MMDRFTKRTRGLRRLTLPGAAAALLSVVIGGCQTLTDGTPTPGPEALEVGVTTKKQVYERLGTPRDVFYSSDQQVLLYYQDVARGMGVEFRFYALPLLVMGHRATGTDTLIVTLDEAGIVRDVQRTDASDYARYRIWPFGD